MASYAWTGWSCVAALGRHGPRVRAHAHARAYFGPCVVGARACGPSRAAREAASRGESEQAGRLECRWQREQLPDAIRELVLDDQRLRNAICWQVFEC